MRVFVLLVVSLFFSNANAFDFEPWLGGNTKHIKGLPTTGVVYLKDRDLRRLFIDIPELMITCTEYEPDTFSIEVDFGDRSAVFEEEGILMVSINDQTPQAYEYVETFDPDKTVLAIVSKDLVADMAQARGVITFSSTGDDGMEHTHTFHLNGFKDGFSDACDWHAEYATLVGGLN